MVRTERGWQSARVVNSSKKLTTVRVDTVDDDGDLAWQEYRLTDEDDALILEVAPFEGMVIPLGPSPTRGQPDMAVAAANGDRAGPLAGVADGPIQRSDVTRGLTRGDLVTTTLVEAMLAKGAPDGAVLFGPTVLGEPSRRSRRRRRSQNGQDASRVNGLPG
jgi:hypothetical protein